MVSKLSSIVCLFSTICALVSLNCSTNQVHAAGRTIRIPLGRIITQSIGSLGQPVVTYLAPVDIGTPSKTFQVQFDVNLNDLFVPHYTWNPFKTNLHYSTGFQCKVSSSCIKNDRQMLIDYMGNKLTGKPYEDFVLFGSAYAIKADGKGNETSGPIKFRQNFLAISDASDARFKNYPLDGFFGLGPVTQSSSTCNNLLLSMHQSNLIDNLQFSMWFNPVLDSNQGGELILGGVDINRYQGQVFWHPISGLAGNRWALNLRAVHLGGQQIGCLGIQAPNNCQVILSSGVNEVYGPREEVQKIYNLLNTSRQSSGLEQIDCRRLPNLPMLTFQVDGIPYNLLPSNYIRKMNNGHTFKEETCYVAILPLESGARNEWILGTNFMGAYYNIFDITYRQVGFAALR